MSRDAFDFSLWPWKLIFVIAASAVGLALSLWILRPKK
jgi:hypothetical protein